MGPDELIRLIGDSPFFGSLGAEERLVFAREGRLSTYESGRALFEPREAPTTLWLVVEGLVEICRQEDPFGPFEAVAYMGPGVLIGENKIITGTPFQSMARFPEGGSTIQWSRSMVLRRLGVSNQFAMHFLHHLARRLEGTFNSLGRSGAKLEGKLDHFDLETILQTVASSGSTGVLEISGSTGTKFGSVYTDQGMVGPIHCGRLRGEEAFLEILGQRPEKGEFCFTPLSTARANDGLFKLQVLLLESARLFDECRRLEAEVPEGAVFHSLSRNAHWAGSGDASLRNKIWHMLGAAPASIEELLERLPYSRVRLSLTLHEMLVAGELSIEGRSGAVASWVAEGL